MAKLNVELRISPSHHWYQSAINGNSELVKSDCEFHKETNFSWTLTPQKILLFFNSWNCLFNKYFVFPVNKPISFQMLTSLSSFKSFTTFTRWSSYLLPTRFKLCANFCFSCSSFLLTFPSRQIFLVFVFVLVVHPEQFAAHCFRQINFKSQFKW